MAKEVIVIRKDLNMRRGKQIAQAAHAPLELFLKTMNGGKTLRQEEPKIVNGKYHLSIDIEVGSQLDDWLRGLHKKIVVYVKSEKELIDLSDMAQHAGIPNYLITDSGLTEFNGVKTLTALIIGPDDEDKINAITGHLPLL